VLDHGIAAAPWTRTVHCPYTMRVEPVVSVMPIISHLFSL
jgi:hypothetical protein